MNLNDYRFRSRWHVEGDRDAVFDALADLPSYPRWWPQVRAVEPVDEENASVVARSFLPYALRFTLTRETENRETGVLQVRIGGDLDGWARLTLYAGHQGCMLLYEQRVVVTRPLLRATAPFARPAFRWNHALMMRAGERGLTDYVRRSVMP
ncbi:MAG: SRPBCC family protein [Nocardioidaceae bacterium]